MPLTTRCSRVPLVLLRLLSYVLLSWISAVGLVRVGHRLPSRVLVTRQAPPV